MSKEPRKVIEPSLFDKWMDTFREWRRKKRRKRRVTFSIFAFVGDIFLSILGVLFSIIGAFSWFALWVGFFILMFYLLYGINVEITTEGEKTEVGEALDERVDGALRRADKAIQEAKEKWHIKIESKDGETVFEWGTEDEEQRDVWDIEQVPATKSK